MRLAGGAQWAAPGRLAGGARPGAPLCVDAGARTAAPLCFDTGAKWPAPTPLLLESRFSQRSGPTPSCRFAAPPLRAPTRAASSAARYRPRFVDLFATERHAPHGTTRPHPGFASPLCSVQLRWTRTQRRDGRETKRRDVHNTRRRSKRPEQSHREVGEAERTRKVEESRRVSPSRSFSPRPALRCPSCTPHLGAFPSPPFSLLHVAPLACSLAQSFDLSFSLSPCLSVSSITVTSRLLPATVPAVLAPPRPARPAAPTDETCFPDPPSSPASARPRSAPSSSPSAIRSLPPLCRNPPGRTPS